MLDRNELDKKWKFFTHITNEMIRKGDIYKKRQLINNFLMLM